ncbi:phosphotransferase enzyme family [Cordyceps militaris]|uniref:Phosphotransferase enzyme family n=1 Tax=Cordyceps militaris TaxID=73501 RepID=A0A2H4SQY3_CORMI|nr:phosphotransferase enzyme family [Cordyceps militaris]
MAELQVPSRSDVEALCRVDGSQANGLEYSDQIWVKYGIYVKLKEAAMQQYVHEHADPHIVRVPQVFDAFTTTQPNGASVTYIVMENVKGDDCAAYGKWHPQMAEQAVSQIANAARHIWEIPLPPNVTIGPFEQQRPVDRFFSDCGSDRSFQNVMQLEDWVNAKLEEGGHPDRVELQGERLSICHCDLTQFNIKMGEPIAILDWGFAGIYPRAFEEFALVHQFNLRGQKFAKALHRQLFGPKLSKHMRALALAARFHAFGC